MTALLAALSALGAGAGLWLLRERWAGRVDHRLFLLFAWVLLAASAAGVSLLLGTEVGIAVSLVILGVAAPLAVFASTELRSPARGRSRTRAASEDAPSLDPQERTRRTVRATVRWLAAFFVAGLLSLGTCILFATRAPLGEVDRIAIAGLAIPVLWGACMAWLFMTDRVLSLTLGLACVGGGSLALALL